MNITETSLKGLNNKPKPYVKYNAPRPINTNLPPMWFCAIMCSVKGAGKTFSAVNLIQNYIDSGIIDPSDNEKMIPRVIYLSPTATSKQNSILNTLGDYLDDQDVYEDVNEDIVKKVFDDLVLEKNKIEDIEIYVKTYKKILKVDIKKLNYEEIFILNQYDFEKPEVLFKDVKYTKPRVPFVIFDDLISNPIFSNKRSNFINWWTIRHRHISKTTVPCNIIFITQNLKSISSVLRKQCDLWVLFKNPNRKKLIEQVWDEVSGSGVSIEQFTQYFDYICEQKFGSLIISCHKDDHIPVRMGWGIKLSMD